MRTLKLYIYQQGNALKKKFEKHVGYLYQGCLATQEANAFSSRMIGGHQN